MASLFHTQKTLLFILILFVIGSIITYFTVLTPRVEVDNKIVKESDASMLLKWRVLTDGLDALANKVVTGIHWNETFVNKSGGLSIKHEGARMTKYENREKGIRLLCWIMTSPKTLWEKARHIKNTWGPRCDRILYMSSKENATFPAVGLNVSEGRDALWNKTKAAFEYIYRHNYTENYDWFLKADDDTYVIVENLKYFLKDKDANEPIYYGHNFKVIIRNGYMSGGAGYVLSKYAVEKLFTNGSEIIRTSCDKHSSSEDVTIGCYLDQVGVKAGDSRDSLNRSRFLPLPLSDMLQRHIPDWYFTYAKYKLQEGIACCSDYLISCHYVSPRQMYAMEYFVYHLRAALPNSDHTYNINKTRLSTKIF